MSDTTYSIVRFGIPDQSIGPEGRGLFAFPPTKEVKEETLPLHDARTSSDIVRGAGGLDVQGFAFINHMSKLAETGAWFDGNNIEEIYFPEVIDLVCHVTGAKKAAILDSAFRHRLADKQADLSFYRENGDGVDKELTKLPRDTPLVYGKEAGGSLEPARQAHIDYSNTGLRSTARYRRQDITKLAEKALKAEDSANAGESVAVPRYAVYSVWRPVEEVRRDPLAVCDVRSANRSEWEASSVRAISNVTKNGEYHLQSLLILPPREPDQQKWYWAPHQRPDEVLIVKAADTAADEDSTISPGCPHVSPIVPGTESEPPRCSIECRVIAFWE